MSADILDDLKSWLAQLVKDKPHREHAGELPEIEIDYVRRAIAEIGRLRQIVAEREKDWEGVDNSFPKSK
jgi:hypothetical protein